MLIGGANADRAASVRRAARVGGQERLLDGTTGSPARSRLRRTRARRRRSGSRRSPTCTDASSSSRRRIGGPEQGSVPGSSTPSCGAPRGLPSAAGGGTAVPADGAILTVTGEARVAAARPAWALGGARPDRPPPFRQALTHSRSRGVPATSRESNLRPFPCPQKVSGSSRHKMPAKARLRSATRVGRPRPVHNQSPATQTHNPTDDAKKTCKCRPSRERLMGFEPTTFCMASRT
jgi:hypothetical protein